MPAHPQEAKIKGFSMNNFTLLDGMPDLITSEDLIKIGLYNNHDGAYQARVKRTSPDYIKVGRRILFPKNAVIAFIENKIIKSTKQ